jgi:hypothetical protein
MPPATFIEAGEAAKDPANNIGALTKRYNKGDRDSEFIKKYVEVMTSAYMDVSDVAQEYVDAMSDSELYTEETLRVLASGMNGKMDHPFFKILAEKQLEFEKVAQPEMVRQVLGNTAKGSIYQAIQRRDEATFQKRMNQIQVLDPSIRGEISSFGYMTKSKVEKNYNDYIKHTKKYTKKYIADDWSGLNSLAWEIYEDEQHAGKKYLKLGAKMAKKSVKLESNYFNNDTYAALLFKQGKFSKAKGFAESAIRLAREANQDAGETEKLLEKIKAKL